MISSPWTGSLRGTWAGASFSWPEVCEACRHLERSQKSLALPKFRGVGQEGARMDRREESHSHVKERLSRQASLRLTVQLDGL